MRGVMLAAITILTQAVLVVTQERAADVDHWQRSLRFGPGAERSLEIDNIWGSIDVIGGDQQTVDVVVNRIITARSADARAAAERDVHLLITENTPVVSLYVDGPFRGCERNRARSREWRNPGYEVRYEFQVRAPREAVLRLKTVNDGHVRVHGTSGRFDLQNVNGKIEVDDVAGGGMARTVNGDVRVTYRSNPREAVQLQTLNGDVVARFARGLSADMWVKTNHGDVFTDYEFSPLPARMPVAEQRGSLRVWRTAPGTGVRVGSGGPSFEFETFNGDIRILRGAS